MEKRGELYYTLQYHAHLPLSPHSHSRSGHVVPAPVYWGLLGSLLGSGLNFYTIDHFVEARAQSPVPFQAPPSGSGRCPVSEPPQAASARLSFARGTAPDPALSPHVAPLTRRVVFAHAPIVYIPRSPFTLFSPKTPESFASLMIRANQYQAQCSNAKSAIMCGIKFGKRDSANTSCKSLSFLLDSNNNRCNNVYIKITLRSTYF